MIRHLAILKLKSPSFCTVIGSMSVVTSFLPFHIVVSGSGKSQKMNKQTVAASEVIVGLPEKGFLQFYIQICILWTSVGFARRLISQFRYCFPLYVHATKDKFKG
jgi:hypothetical protein